VFVADEPVIDETVEQDVVTEEVPQVEDAAPDTENVLADAPDDVEPTEPQSMPDETLETIDEPDPLPLPDLTGIDLDALKEQRPDLVEVLANAERQRTTDRMKKEAGNAQVTRALAEAQMRKLGVDPATVTDASSWNLMAENARAYEQDAVMRSVAKSVADTYGLDPEIRAGFETTIDGLNGQPLTDMAGNLFREAVAGKAATQVSEVRLADIPQGSQLRKDLDAEIVKVRAAERKAAGISASTPKEPAPSSSGIPVNTDVGDTDPLLLKLETQGRSALTDAELVHARELLGVKAR
jgi:hypothetical protein